MSSIFNQKLSIEDRVLKATIALQRKAPFYSFIVMNMRIKDAANDRVDRAAINRYGDLWYNKEWMDTQSDQQIMFILAHEASHVSTLSFDRIGSRDHILWNIATDLVINDMLIQDKFTPPSDIYMTDKHGIWTQSFDDIEVEIDVRNSTAEEVYEQLEKHGEKLREKIKALSSEFGNNEQNNNTDGFLDYHIYDNEGNKDESDTPADRSANAEKWKKLAATAQTVSNMRGVHSTIMQRELPALMNPKLDWRSKLQRFITSRLPTDLTMRSPGRRSHILGYYMPSVLKESLTVVIAPDISGSIDEKQYCEMMTETVGILNGYPQIKTILMPWAYDILDDDVITLTRNDMDRLLTYQPKNCGGTMFSCVKQYMEEKRIKADVCVVLTDGYIENNPDIPNCATIVVITKSGTSDNFTNTGVELCSLRDY